MMHQDIVQVVAKASTSPLPVGQRSRNRYCQGYGFLEADQGPQSYPFRDAGQSWLLQEL